MDIPTVWKKSSYSGGGEGNDCVEVADGHPHIRIRDSKTPAGAILTVPAGAFVTFVDALKDVPHSTVTDFARLRG